MTTYQRLGDYIREVNVRNLDLRSTNLLGLSMSKQFRPSTSNIVGVDLSKYKVVSKNVFAFDPMSVIRVHKVPIAMNDSDSPIIVSPAYYTFECKDENKLDPRFLMMWFKRTEFDRYADFKSDAAVRGGYDWNELCDTIINLPSIERQREIVLEYETLTNRIHLNEQMIQHIEATAQALYRKMFVDNIDKENLPAGWRMGTLGEVCESFSKTHRFDKVRLIFLNTSDIYEGKILLHDYSDINKMPGQAKKEITNGDILFSEIRPANKRYAIVKEKHPEDFVVSTKLMVLRMRDKSYSNLKLYFYLTLPEVLDDLQKQADGSSGTFPQITFDGNLRNRDIIIGDTYTENKWEEFLTVYYNNVWEREKENSKLTELQSLLLAKMGQ